MAFVHTSVNHTSKQYLTSERRYNYTTPKSFLEQIKLYRSLLSQKSHELRGKMERLENGLQKLNSTSAQVDDLKAKLAAQEVELKQKNEDADRLIQEVGVETDKVSKEKAVADAEEQKVAAIAVVVSGKQKDCEEDLAKAEPALLAAQDALNTLNKNNLTELKSFGSPVSAVTNVTAAVMVLTAPNGKVPKDRSWKAAKVMMAKVDAFLDSLISFDKENIHEACLKAIQPYLQDKEFQPDLVASKSQAAAGLCSWVLNIVKFYQVYCEVEPKRQALSKANSDLATAQDKLRVIKSKISVLDENLAKLTAKFEKATADKLKCQQQAQSTARTISLANRLVGGLASENVRWAEAVDTFKQQESSLCGDVLLITAFVSYLGYFTRAYRHTLMEQSWRPFFQQLQVPIPVTSDLDPLTMLTDDADVATWQNQGLPADHMSTENATILSSCQRWPLMVDPQLQGVKWVKNRYGDGLRVIRMGQRGYLDSIERALAAGEVVLIENMEETLDPVLGSLLGRETIKKGRYIKIGDKECEYNPSFRLILHTKLANPHYQPELQAQCTLINFTVTRDGLEEQLLASVVSMERPDLEQLKSELTTEQNGFKITLKTLEDNLLSRLSSASGDFLGDTELVENLETTKRTAADIQEKVKEAKVTEAKINEAREHYRPAAARASLLYFIMNDLNKIHPMYQFSLKAFSVVFQKAVERADPDETLTQRVSNLIHSITWSVFQYTTRGLFECDKLTYTAQLAFQVLLMNKEISSVELDFLLRFPVQPGLSSPVDFLSNHSWGGVKSLCTMEEFRNLDRDMEGSAKRWRKFAESECPEKEPFPQEWKNKTALQKLCMMRALRPDRMTYAVRDFVEQKLGSQYVSGRALDFAVSFEESGPATPMFFVLSPGVDPLKDVEKHGKKLGFTLDNKNFHNVSLGQGQELVAEQALASAAEEGHWVILQVPYDDLRYLFGEIMYGDTSRTTGTGGEHQLAPGFLLPKNMDYSGYHQYIDEALPPESPHLYGLHPNAEIGFLTQSSDKLFRTILELQPRDGGGAEGGGATREDKVRAVLEELLEKLPEQFNMTELLSKAEERTPYQVVALQECERMNLLTQEMNRSLRELALGLKGELTMSTEMESLQSALFLDMVPVSWVKRAYPSVCGLSLWFTDLLMRVRELETWAADFALPPAVWLSDSSIHSLSSPPLCRPQHGSKKWSLHLALNAWPLDSMCLQCDVTKKNREDLSSAPETEPSYTGSLWRELAGHSGLHEDVRGRSCSSKPELISSQKLSKSGPDQYLDGRPLEHQVSQWKRHMQLTVSVSDKEIHLRCFLPAQWRSSILVWAALSFSGTLELQVEVTLSSGGQVKRWSSGEQQRERNCSCGVRFWSGWTVTSCPRGVAQKVCVQGEKGQLLSDLHAPSPGDVQVLETYRSWRDGRLQPITFSAERTMRCSLCLSLTVAPAYHTVMEEVRMDSMMAV
ncbi:hypothetical protein WMY93_010396 [Mugilogobius chulae]|uniref:Uncharacterized protein n=1 Tax=Mugilogobius chulae TaxID=88201 RepID=A0AAW0PG56_9GOBI